MAVLSSRDALAYRFAIDKLAQLNAGLNTRNADPAAPEVSLSLEDAITECVEAKSALGACRLGEAVQSYLATITQVRRAPLRLAVNESLEGRQRLTIPTAAGKRPALSPKLHYQEKLRLSRFTKAFDGDICDLTRDHLDLFFREHLAKLSAKSRNHYRGTLRQWINFCAGRDYLQPNSRLTEASGLKHEVTYGRDVEVYTSHELKSLLKHVDGALRALIAIGGLAGLRTEELLRLD